MKWPNVGHLCPSLSAPLSAFPFPLLIYLWYFDTEVETLCLNLRECDDDIANKYICQENMSVPYQVFPSHKVGKLEPCATFFCFVSLMPDISLVLPCVAILSLFEQEEPQYAERKHFFSLQFQAGCLSAESWLRSERVRSNSAPGDCR